MKNHVIVIACLVLLGMGTPVICSARTSPAEPSDEYVEAYAKGAHDAALAFSAGTPAIEVYGKRPGRGYPDEQYLEAKYGVARRIVAGCMVDDRIVGHAKGFNSAMREFLNRKYKVDIFEEARSQRAATADIPAVEVKIRSPNAESCDHAKP